MPSEIQFVAQKKINLTRLAPLLDDIHDRLAGVTIECLDWAAFLDRYDRPGTLFYPCHLRSFPPRRFTI